VLGDGESQRADGVTVGGGGVGDGQRTEVLIDQTESGLSDSLAKAN
jgi:hypothetical protein